MSDDLLMELSLTDDQSHRVRIPLGQGSFSMGLIGMNPKKFDVLLEKDLAVNWKTFEEIPYLQGRWPRYFYYWGNDRGFIDWSYKREIESFFWCPQKAISEDLSLAFMRHFSVQVEEHKVDLSLGENIRNFSAEGNLQNLEILKVQGLSTAGFSPEIVDESKSSYQLPEFPALKEIESIDISMKPIGQPFDCQSLLQFPNLESVSLSGNLTNLSQLKKLVKLEGLALRFVPNLDDLPALDSWPKLNSFIAWNVAESKGKLLRVELRKLKKERKMEYSTVSKLRKPIWFTTVYGIPFSGWEEKLEKKAIRLYKSAMKKLKKCTDEEEAEVLIKEFTLAFNEFPAMETSEREDIGEAVLQLIQIPSFIIDAKKGILWFDQVRDY